MILRPAPSGGKVMYVGQLYPWKGVDVLVRAMQDVPRGELTVVGGLPPEPDLERVKRLAAELGLEERVHFRGFVPPPELDAEKRQASVFVIPNLDSTTARLFTSPLKLFEAMACGRPIVASDLPSIGEAETSFDETFFRSVRKDGRLVNAVTMEGRTELSLTPPLPSRLRYRLRVPDAPILRFATGAATLGDETLAAPLELRMILEADGNTTEVFTDLFRRRAANRWRDHEVDLSPWAGKQVELVLESAWKANREVRQPILAAGETLSSPMKRHARASRTSYSSRSTACGPIT